MNTGLHEVRTLLGPLDPAATPGGLATADRRSRDLAAILANDTPGALPVTPRPVRPRRLAIAAGLAAVVAAATVIAVVTGVLPLAATQQTGPAATPPPLAYTLAASATTTTTASLLEQIAAHTERLAAERSTGYAHLKTLEWSLWTRVDHQAATSVIVPIQYESWRAPDGSTTLTRRYQKPRLHTDRERADWDRMGRPGATGKTTTEHFGPGSGMWSTSPPADPTSLAAYLAIGHPAQNGPAETFTAITDLVGEQALTPLQRAALLRVLATVPGLAYTGDTTDRAGRHGVAVSVPGTTGLASQITLIIDPATGRVLDQEELLLEAGKLNVRVPAIITYEVYQTAEFADPPR